MIFDALITLIKHSLAALLICSYHLVPKISISSVSCILNLNCFENSNNKLILSLYSSINKILLY